MTEKITSDFSAVTALAVDLAAVPATMHRNVRKAVEVTARHTRDAWREPLAGSATVPGGDSTVSYDLKVSPAGVSAEIGPEIGGIGSIVSLLDGGTPTTPPTAYGADALKKNVGDFYHGLSIAIEVKL